MVAVWLREHGDAAERLEMTRLMRRRAGAAAALYACLGLSENFALEMANAFNAGTGPGTPDAFGVIQPGTIAPGTVVELNGDANWIAGTSSVVDAAMPKALFFVHEGSVDLVGRNLGKLTALRGLARFLTSYYNGTGFVPGSPLVANAGRFEAKVFGDKKQVVGYVGPDAERNGRLDVIFEAASWG